MFRQNFCHLQLNDLQSKLNNKYTKMLIKTNSNKQNMKMCKLKGQF